VNSRTDLQLKLVRQLLAKIIDGAFTTGTHLREVELSKYFGVSRTPLRAALAQATALGAAERGGGRGLYVKASPEQAVEILASLPQEDEEQLKEQIARDWFEGKIPRDVSESFFRQRYGLGKKSRVLGMLADEGIITRSPGYGWQFEPTLNSQESNDASYDFRLLVEPGAILQATFRYHRARAAAIRSRHERVLNSQTRNLPELFRLDEEFHQFIAECSRNPFIIHAVAQQNKLRRLLEYASLIDTGRLNASCAEHLEILDALDEGKHKQAADAMARHLLKAKGSPPEFKN
jgi:DNA-binding GntR family transcriptional regulator